MPTVNTDYDVAIIGCGVMGASTAYQLSRETDLDVVVFEKNAIGSGSTGKSAGVIRFHYGENAHYTHMVDRAYSFWENADDHLGKDIGFTRLGVVFLARDDEDHGERAGYEIVKQIGRRIEILDREDLREVLPFLHTDDLDYGVYCRDAGIADPYAAAMAFYERAQANGVDFEIGTAVTGLLGDPDGITGVETASGTFECGSVVSAAGPWSASLLSQVGVDLPLSPTREQVMIVQPDESFLTDYPYPFPHVTAKSGGHVYFRPDTADTLLVSGHHKGEACNPDRYSDQIDSEFIQWAIGKLAHRAPALSDAKFVRGYSGVYSNTPDKDFILDEPVPNLVVLAGFSGHGFKHAPVIGEIARDLVQSGDTDIVDLDRFSLDRFSDRRVVERDTL